MDNALQRCATPSDIYMFVEVLITECAWPARATQVTAESTEVYSMRQRGGRFAVWVACQVVLEEKADHFYLLRLSVTVWLGKGRGF